MKRLLLGLFVLSISFCKAVLDCPEHPPIDGGVSFSDLVARCLCSSSNPNDNEDDCPYPGIPLGCWDTSRVTDMSFGFFNNDDANNNDGECQAATFNEPIGGWDTSGVTDMRYLFGNARGFNQPIGDWNTTSVRNMEAVFFGASSFNQSINTWDVSSVETLFYLFLGASSFNQPLDGWNTSSVRNMNGVFGAGNDVPVAVPFNQNIETWDTSRVTTMAYMFQNNIHFNQPLDDWDLSNVFRMERMFRNASSFDQCLSTWPQKTLGDRRGYDNGGDEDETTVVPMAKTWLLRSDPSIFLGTGCPLDPSEADRRTRPGRGPWCRGPEEGCFVEEPTDEVTFPPTELPTEIPTLAAFPVETGSPTTTNNHPSSFCVEEDPGATYQINGGSSSSTRSCRWLSQESKVSKKTKRAKRRKEAKQKRAWTQKKCKKEDRTTGEKVSEICPITCGRAGTGDCSFLDDDDIDDIDETKIIL